MPKPKNAILSACTGYGVREMEPFLNSLQAHDTEAHLVLFGDKRALRDKEAIESIYPETTLVDVSNPFWLDAASRVIRNRWTRKIRSQLRGLRKSQEIAAPRSEQSPSMEAKTIRNWNVAPGMLDISVSRLFHAAQWLEAHAGGVEQVLLTDCRDVIFQSNPFRNIPDQIHAGAESINLGEESFTGGWITALYGDKVLDAMAGQPVLCSGVILGDLNSILQLLERCCMEVHRHYRNIGLRRGFDQGIFNYVCYRESERMPCVALSLESEILTTLSAGSASQFRMREQSIEHVESDAVPAIVHQYDRVPEFKERLLKIYGS
jgi:hypothetical protein